MACERRPAGQQASIHHRFFSAAPAPKALRARHGPGHRTLTRQSTGACRRGRCGEAPSTRRTLLATPPQHACWGNSKPRTTRPLLSGRRRPQPGRYRLADALASDKLDPWSKPLLKLYVYAVIAFLCSTMNGYDGSIFGSLPAMEGFRERFQVEKTGSKLGYISAMYTVGTIASLPVTGPACDFRGRRMGIFVGSIIVIASTILSGLAKNTSQFVAGRFFLGFGVSITRAASSIWIAEISPPNYRGVLTAFYNCTYSVGALLAAGVTRGSVQYGGDVAWQIPVWCQMICPGIVCLSVLTFPESPRWMFANRREEQALAFLTKYHGAGRSDHPLVRLQMDEYRQVITVNGSDKHWWDYSDLYKTRSDRWRMLNALLPLHLGPVLRQCCG
ncbi:hypothetical protein ACCO45_002532 [Purpureocillium lilacinum]|uniref:Uncharacterized protein n=1 Tax=Purpureocillium lilacinum TaxID=33203 RepID=A0ACC4ECD5_PURLI